MVIEQAVGIGLLVWHRRPWESVKRRSWKLLFFLGVFLNMKLEQAVTNWKMNKPVAQPWGWMWEGTSCVSQQETDGDWHTSAQKILYKRKGHLSEKHLVIKNTSSDLKGKKNCVGKTESGTVRQNHLKQEQEKSVLVEQLTKCSCVRSVLCSVYNILEGESLIFHVMRGASRAMLLTLKLYHGFMNLPCSIVSPNNIGLWQCMAPSIMTLGVQGNKDV